MLKKIFMGLMIGCLSLSAGITSVPKKDLQGIKDYVKSVKLSDLTIEMMAFRNKEHPLPTKLDEASTLISYAIGDTSASLLSIVEVDKQTLINSINRLFKRRKINIVYDEKMFDEKIGGNFGPKMFNVMKNVHCLNAIDNIYLNKGVIFQYKYIWNDKKPIIDFTIAAEDCN